MIFMDQAEVYELSIVPPQADACTPCTLLNSFRVCFLSFAVSRLPFHVLTILKSLNIEIF